MADTETEICLPDIGAAQIPLQISSWLVNIGEAIQEGDRIVEVLIPGMTFDINSPRSGVLIRIEKSSGAFVKQGDVLGYLRPVATEIVEL
jgi:pyruvate/2-oxoglutarate dehydrogenase complex dihydrolipoamide acyltransferase (E2) component